MKSSDYEIYIVSSQQSTSAQQLLKAIKYHGFRCKIVNKLKEKQWSISDHMHRLALFDLDIFDTKRPLIPTECLEAIDDQRVAIFNWNKNEELELAALQAGIEGVIPQMREELTIKAIKHILIGDMWFSRRTLSRFIHTLTLEKQIQIDAMSDQMTHEYRLTKKEQQVLGQLLLGAPNKEIANILKISTHTVKVHLYHIFKKTKSRNRSEVICWANTHMANVN